MRGYQLQQSFFSRLTILRLRLHHTFQLILATQPTTPLPLTSAAVAAAMESTTRVFRPFAPFGEPFPRTLYHHFLTLNALTTPATAHQVLTHGRRLGLLGDDSVVTVMEGYARHGNGDKVRELIDEVRRSGERVTVRMYEALLDALKGDAVRLREAREDMRRRRVKLSDKCWLLMLPAYTNNQPAGLQQLLVDMSNEQTPVAADLAHAIVAAFPPSDYMSAVQSAGGASAVDTFVLSQMEYHLSHPTTSSPEQLHHLLQSSPSLHSSSRAHSMVLQAYARREHVQTGKVALYDVLVIERLLADMTTASVAEDEWALQVRMLLAAQRGEGDHVLALMQRTAESFQPPASLFLPVLRSIASLTHPQRLPVLLSLHSYLHSRRLTSHFSFSLVLSLQSSLADIAGIRSTLAAMKTASVPLTIHHWHQLLLSSPNSTQVTLLRDMMAKLHVLPSAYTDAIVLSKQTTLRDAEQYYASLLEHSVSPHPVLRVAMADVYGAVGAVRWACRQWWKIVSGSAERVTKVEDESRDEWTVMGEVSVEEMDRMLRRLQTADVGSRSDVHDMRHRLQTQQQEQRKREADEVQHYRQLLGLGIELSAEQQRVEALRVTSQQQQVQTMPLLTQRMQAQLARVDAGVQEQVLEMADSVLVKQFGDLVRRLKARLPYVHMDILEHKPTHDEHQQETAVNEPVDWLREAAEAKAQQDETVLLDLDEDVNKQKGKQTATHKADGSEREHGRADDEKQSSSESVSQSSVVDDEDWSMMEAARQLVASRRPKSSV